MSASDTSAEPIAVPLDEVTTEGWVAALAEKAAPVLDRLIRDGLEPPRKPA